MNEPIEYSSLAFGQRFAVAWGFFWRGVLITLGSMIGGGVFGGIIGFAAAMLGLPPENKGVITLLGMAAGGIVGVLFFWLYVNWLFAARIAGHRLRLVKA